MSVVQTGDGGYAFAGSTTSFGAGSADVWLVKTDGSGNMQWNKTYGGSGDDGASSVVQTGDGGYALAGGTNSFGAGGNDCWLIKVDSAGSMQWNKTYGGTGIDGSSSMIQTADGGYALAGDTTSFGAGGYDFWLVKTDANGNALWNKTYGGTQDDSACSVVQTNDGGYALAGKMIPFGPGPDDFWLVKTDSAGNQQWNKTYGGTQDEVAFCMIQMADGGYAIAGETTTQTSLYDGLLLRTDASGNQLWNRTYGGTGQEQIEHLVQTRDGGLALAGGGTWLGGDRSYDVWLFKTDANGNQLWNRSYGGEYFDEAYDVIQTSDGGYALACQSLSFGAGISNFWLIKTDEYGVVPEFSTMIVPMALLVTVTVAAILLGKKIQVKPRALLG